MKKFTLPVALLSLSLSFTVSFLVYRLSLSGFFLFFYFFDHLLTCACDCVCGCGHDCDKRTLVRKPICPKKMVLFLGELYVVVHTSYNEGLRANRFEKRKAHACRVVNRL